ncbi:RNA methyltransferase [Desulfamplus magnetovallimortis]|nr:RNA methyltransferase [Desulfamplus magnetovallimortis]
MNNKKISNITVVLHQPGYPENIGSAARAMCNMGIGKLIVVEPRNYNHEAAAKLATHSAKQILEQMEIYESLKDALAPFHYIVGTTARLGGQRVVESPREVAERVAHLSLNNSIAMLFGREDRGLSNEELKLCHTLVNIPTSGFSSLNLAQAVMVVCYELFIAKSTISVNEEPLHPLLQAENSKHTGNSTQEGKEQKRHSPRLAQRRELDIMYDELENVLSEISYINPENPDFWMNHLRNFLGRISLQAKEVSIIRGIIRQVLKYGEQKS